jgi:hypothetical protein
MQDVWNQKVDHPIQSWEWGEFRKQNGNLITRINNYQIVWSKVPYLPFYFGYCGKSAVPSESDLEAIRILAKSINGIGVRFEPNVLKDQSVSLSKKLVKGRRFFTPKTFWLDLTLSEEELLKNMHPKARYNIRLAQKHEVMVKEDNSPEAFTTYLKLAFETASRQGFFAHNPDYHQLMWNILHPAGIAHLFTATYQGETLAAWIIFKFNTKIYYPYGSSSDKHKEVMATSLLLWEIAKWGKHQGCTLFDLWGVEEGKGFTEFKRKFGPQEVEFIGTYDLPINIWYWLFRFMENTRWWILGKVSTMQTTLRHWAGK